MTSAPHIITESITPVYWLDRSNWPKHTINQTGDELELCGNCACYYWWASELKKIDGILTGPCCIPGNKHYIKP